MEHIYNFHTLLKKSLCRIIFVNEYETAMDLRAHFIEKNPKYISEINKDLHPYHKLGPFKIKNKKSLFKLLYKTEEIKSCLRENGAACAVSYVKDELKKMDLSYLVDRIPAAMSMQQRTRASYLYDILDGKFDFLMCDSKSERTEDREKRIASKISYFTMAEYMRCSEQYEFAMYELVWITDLSIDEMLELLSDSAKENDYSFFSLKGTDIIELDKEKLLSSSVKAEAPVAKTITENSQTTMQDTKSVAAVTDAENAYNEARKYDRFRRTGRPQYSGTDNLQKAFEFYRIAAEIGHPGAQFNLGDMYCYGNEVLAKDKEKALHWYCMAEFNNNYSGTISDNEMGEIHYLVPMRIKNLILQIPNGKEFLRKYAGNKADILIQEAEHEAKIQKILDSATPIDQDYFNRMMDKALGKKY